MHLREVLAHVSLRRLTRAETFCYLLIFACQTIILSHDSLVCWITWILCIHNEAMVGIIHQGDALSPLLPEHGSNTYGLVFSCFSSTGQRPASYCHGIVSVVCLSVHLSVCPYVRASVNSSFKRLLLRNY